MTHIAVAPLVVVALAKGEAIEKYDLRSLKVVGCGGAPLAKDVIERFKLIFPDVRLEQVGGKNPRGKCGKKYKKISRATSDSSKTS